jgi:hypothetical protein
MRYFTKEFLFNPGPNWTVNLDDAQPLADVLVKHVKTGHIWRLNGEHEPWQGTTIYLGRWPD